MQVLLIVAFAGLMLRDQLGIIPLGLERLSHGAIALLSLLPMIGLGAITHTVSVAAGRAMDRSGSLRAIGLMDRTMALTRWGGVVLHLVNVLALGWLDVVRAWVGDLVLVDELIAVAPLLLLMVAGWSSAYNIDRRLREAALLGSIDAGVVIDSILTRAEFVVMQVRHHLLLVLVPMSLLIAWSESMVLLANALMDRAAGPSALDRLGAWLAADGHAAWAVTLAQLVGVLLVLGLLPLAIGWLWDVTPLSDGPMRDRLVALCRASRVRVGRLLVWRTRGTLVNGAVLGLAVPTRCILLTDALLENLPSSQVEAVMAHEVAHVRRRHMIWLAVAMLASVGLTAALGEYALRAAGMLDAGSYQSDRWAIGLSGLSLAAGLWVFGFVSRRFEWQADAFAVQTLSRMDPAHAGAVMPAAIESMAGALTTVARLNHIPPDKFTWRHGSIRTRLANLLALGGRPVDALPIDRTVRRIKLLCAVGALASIALMIWPNLLFPAAGGAP